MASTPYPNTPRWLLEVTAAAAPADPAAFEEQRQLLRSATAFHRASRTWGTYIGALDVRALTVLQRLYGAAQQFGTEVRIQVIAAPATWNGPCFTEAGELAALAVAGADRGRQLGQLRLLTRALSRPADGCGVTYRLGG
ncbi:hypothetical protein [Streptomyces phaeochromogenes]